MADVTPPSVPGSDAAGRAVRGRDRGQLFLVGALALSVILVTLAVLLNTAIYTGNIATRDPGTGSADVIEYRAAANEMAGSTLTGVNYRNNESYSALESNFSESVGNWSVAATKHSVVKGTDAHTNATSTTRGTRIVQDGNRNFSNATSDANWVLAENVRVRDYTLTVNQSTLDPISEDDTADDFTGTFTVSITDSNTSTWDVHVYDLNDGNSEVRVAVVAPDSELATCSTGTTGSATIDLTNASLGGKHCGALDFWSSSSPNFKIEHSNGNAAHGNYSLVVDKDTASLDKSDYNNDAGPSPYYTPALYSAEVEVDYRSPTVDYSTQFRVAPGEYDA